MARRLVVPRGYEDAVLAETMLRMQAPKQGSLRLIADPEDPVTFVRDALGEDPWQLQEEILCSLRDNPRTAVRKCHSSGGTRAAAQAVCWWLHAYPEDGVVYTLAPTWPQIRDLLWRDIEDIHMKAGLGGSFHPASARWEFGPRCYAIGRSTDQPERLQGPHGGHFLLIIDEASGFPEHLVPAVEGMMASGEVRLLLMSQPTQLHGLFYKAFHTGRAGYKLFGISAYETPNFQGEGVVRPYLIRPDWAEARRQEWGEDSPLYQVRVLGRFPRQSIDSLISLDWIERAWKGLGGLEENGVSTLGIQDQIGGLEDKPRYTLGVDVARYGSDKTAYCLLRDNMLIRYWRRSGRSTMETAGEAKRVHDETGCTVVVDDTGVGGGVTDRLREQNVPTLAVNFGERPRFADEDMANRGSEVWWNLARALERDELYLTATGDQSERDALTAQLLQPTYTYTSAGKIKVEKLGGRDEKAGPSPDLGDALALAWDGWRGGQFITATGSGDTPMQVQKGRVFDYTDPYEEQRSIWRGGGRERLWPE